MTDYPHDAPLQPRRFSVVPNSSKDSLEASSKPIVLALLVADALRKAKLGNAVLEMKASPVGWVNFLVELDSMLREDG